MARTTRTPGAAEPAPEVKTTAQQADEALDAILTGETKPEELTTEQKLEAAEKEIAALKKQLGQKDAPAASTNPDIKPAANKRLVLTDKGWTAEE